MKTTIENLEFPCEIKKKLKMKYLKKNLNIFSFKIFLYDKDTIKVIDCDDKQAYFRYRTDKKEVLFIEEELELNL